MTPNPTQVFPKPPNNNLNEIAYLDEQQNIEGIVNGDSTYILESRKILMNKQENDRKTKKNVHRASKPNEGVVVVWSQAFNFAVIYSFWIYGMYTMFYAKWATIAFAYVYLMFTAFGITAGVHRLWSHRTYTAKLPLRIFLMCAQSGCYQNDILEWARDHRVHHKFTDTDADPHNSRRGLFFSHVGWLMCRKHQEVLEKGKTIDMSDVLSDPVVKFQRRYYVPLMVFFCFALPTFIPWYFWGEDGWISFTTSMARYVWSLNCTWLINSYGHMFGMRPYDSTIYPADNEIVSFLDFGEGWHNYHHTFPWDYKTTELGNYRLNFTTCFLDLMAKIGQATELKTAPKELILRKVRAKGDGTWKNGNMDCNDFAGAENKETEELIWGWGDQDITEDDKNIVISYNHLKV